MNLLLAENVDEASGFRTGPQRANAQTEAVRNAGSSTRSERSCSWYTKGFDGGAQFRIGVNSAKSIAELEDLDSEILPR